MKPVIKAMDYIPENYEETLEPIQLMESMHLPKSSRMLLGIFGDLPDYSNPKFEELWQEVFDSEEEDIIAYCLKNNVDVIGKDNEPVPGWRDIAVMLKAIESGLLELA